MSTSKPRKLSKAALKKRAKAQANKAWAELSLKLRNEAGACQKCGRTGHLQVHHLLPKKLYPELLLEESNLVVLCPRCHTFCAGSAHKDGLAFAMWLLDSHPDKFAWLKTYLDRLDGII